METLITLDNLTKSYGKHCVIDHISCDFRKGESIAFTGHNGCGKSTLLKLMAGLIRVSSGRVSYKGKVRFSFVPEKFPAMDISMTDYLYAIAKMEGRDTSEADALIRDFFLDPMRHTRLSELSKGSLQKVGVIQAFLTAADVLFLDEPLSGQDAASQDVFIQKSNELREKGVTIFMSCHEKKLIDELSDREYTIVNGKLYGRTDDSDVFYKVSVRKDDKLPLWEGMTDHGNKLVLRVKRDALKETVMKLYNEGWELSGIEEYI